MAEEPDNYDPEKWKRIKAIPRRIVTDVKETIADLKDEPGEVGYRIKERTRDYFRPYRHRVAYPDPSKKGK